MTADDFRRIALGLEGVVEAAHMNHPDFRVGGRIFATLKEGLESGMVTLLPEDQARFVAEAPDAFALEAGAWGRGGCTRVHLAAADEDMVGEAMTLAWRRRIALNAQKPARKAVARKPAARKPAAKKPAAKKPVARKRKAAKKR